MPTSRTPTAEEILVQTTGTMRDFTGIEQHLAQRLADALAKVEQLKTRVWQLELGVPELERQLRQRVKAAEAREALWKQYATHNENSAPWWEARRLLGLEDAK